MRPSFARVLGNTVIRRSAALAAWISLLGVGGTLATAADDKKPRREAWESFAEEPAVKEYLDGLKAGGFDAKARETLLTTALPLLENPANRRSIERLRKRIRESMLNERGADATTLDQANAAAADWLLGRALAPDVDPVVAVNEVLLVGDMRGPDGRPWAKAGSRLMKIAAEANARSAVRAAALAAVVRHVEAGLALDADAANGIRTIAVTPPTDAGAAGDWLAARALGLLPVVMPKAAPDVASALVKLLGDTSRSVDVRVRAAEALGRSAAEESKVDVVPALAAIRALAIRGLEEDLERAKNEEFGQSLAAGGAMAASGFGGAEFAPRPGGEFAPRPGGEFGGVPGMGFGPGGVVPGGTMAPAVEPTVLEHNAWRLAALAGAIQPTGKAGGLAAVAGDTSAAAKALAAKLRENALILHEWIHPPKEAKGKRPAGAELGFDAGPTADTQPTKQELGQALREALDDLRATLPVGAAAEPAAPVGTDPAPQAADPFGTP